MSRSPSDRTEPHRDALVKQVEFVDIESLSEEIVYAIVENSEKRPQEMEQFRKFIDPDALNTLFPVDDGGKPLVDAEFTFYFEGHRIEIDTDGEVTIQQIS